MTRQDKKTISCAVTKEEYEDIKATAKGYGISPSRFVRCCLYAYFSKTSREYIEQLLDTYYVLRGWDKATGNPTKKKLAELELRSVADVLSKLNLIE